MEEKIKSKKIIKELLNIVSQNFEQYKTGTCIILIGGQVFFSPSWRRFKTNQPTKKEIKKWFWKLTPDSFLTIGEEIITGDFHSENTKKRSIVSIIKSKAIINYD